MLESYFEARREGDARTAAALERKPYTCVLGMLLLLGCVAVAIYLAVFTDSKAEMMAHGIQSAVGLVILGFLFVVFWRLERNSPLPIFARLVIWRALTYAYLAIAAYGVWLVVSGGGYYAIRSLIGLGTLLPVFCMSIHMINRAKAERRHNRQVADRIRNVSSAQN